MSGFPFAAVDWHAVVPTEHPGRTGVSTWRKYEAGNICVRLVEYTAGYEADHWCRRGHILFVLEGDVTVDLEDGRRVALSQGMGFHVADEAEAHRTSSENGARLFIVDSVAG